MSDTPPTAEGQVTVQLTYSLELTPKTGRPKRNAVYQLVADLGLSMAREKLLHEAARLERLAQRNASAGKDFGARSKRFRAQELTAAAGVLAEIQRQIMTGRARPGERA